MKHGKKRWSLSVSKQTRLLIFDWDGTLVNSLPRIVAAMHAAAIKCQLPQREDSAIHAIIGLALPQAFDVLYPEHTEDASLRDAFRQAYGNHYLELEHEPSPFYPGVLDNLENFKLAGYELAVATGKSRRGLAHVLSGHKMENYFHTTRCADETKSKPDPLMLKQILEVCGKTPEQAIMVGDSPFDLRMANNAQMRGVAVSYGAQPLRILLQESPVLAIDHFDELAQWLAHQP